MPRYNEVNWYGKKLQVKVNGDGRVQVRDEDWKWKWKGGKWRWLKLPPKLQEAIEDRLQAAFAHGERCGQSESTHELMGYD